MNMDDGTLCPDGPRGTAGRMGGSLRASRGRVLGDYFFPACLELPLIGRPRTRNR
jgi:hypothetical protein